MEYKSKTPKQYCYCGSRVINRSTEYLRTRCFKCEVKMTARHEMSQKRLLKIVKEEYESIRHRYVIDQMIKHRQENKYAQVTTDDN